MIKVQYNKVRTALITRDIMGLLKMGAPDDEYDTIAKMIVLRVNKDGCKDKEVVLLKVYCVFFENFCVFYNSQNELQDNIRPSFIPPVSAFRNLVKDILA
jgi:hypothetical protein